MGLPRAGSTLPLSRFLRRIRWSTAPWNCTISWHWPRSYQAAARRMSGGILRSCGSWTRTIFGISASSLSNGPASIVAAAPLFIDKMPNNFMHVGLIRLILPRAKIIDARRYPLACCFSGFKQLFGEGQDFTYGLESIGRYYRDYVRLMDHWDEVLPGFVLRVMHESVVDDLETEVRRLLDFCELEFEADCLDFAERSVVCERRARSRCGNPFTAAAWSTGATSRITSDR
ncbi:MAG: sulfotransferase [Woeseiaceae bacterium]|nr:sulfotransferase [Woeseiaceae bacterium]